MEVNDDLNEAVSSEEHEEQEQSKEKEYLLSDGFGLDLEEVRTMIIKKCETKIEKDDPILMIVPILNAALNEQVKIQNEYAAALEKVYQQVLDTFLKSLDERLQSGNYKVEVEHQKQKNPKEILALYGIIIFQTIALLLVYFW